MRIRTLTTSDTAPYARARTLVDTSTGLRPIEQIAVGDRVLSRNPDTGETAYKPVTGLVRRHDREIYAVTLVTTLDDGHEHIATFETTDDHPWRTADGHWRTTLELRPGMTLVRAHGSASSVLSVADTHRTARTYNLEVADFHTYFVGEEHVWVHNACRVGDFPRAERRETLQANRDAHGGNLACEHCGRNDLAAGQRSERGVPTPENQAQVHHDPPIHEGGGRESEAVVEAEL